MSHCLQSEQHQHCRPSMSTFSFNNIYFTPHFFHVPRISLVVTANDLKTHLRLICVSAPFHLHSLPRGLKTKGIERARPYDVILSENVLLHCKHPYYVHPIIISCPESGADPSLTRSARFNDECETARSLKCTKS